MLPCPHCGHPLILLSATAPASPGPPEADVLQQREASLLQYLDTVRTTDAIAAACHLFGVDRPGRVQVERARRVLERLCRAGTLQRTAGRPGGIGGGRVTLYRLSMAG